MFKERIGLRGKVKENSLYYREMIPKTNRAQEAKTEKASHNFKRCRGHDIL
jgi:hypothetical protein